MCRIATFIAVILVSHQIIVGHTQAAEPVRLADVKLDFEKLKNWKEKEYSFRVSAGGNPEDSLGKFIFRTIVTADEIVLQDTLEAFHRGQLVALHVSQHCQKINSLSPTSIETKGEGDEELGTLNITFDGKQVTVKGTGADRKLEIEQPIVTAFAFARIVTLLPKKKGMRVSFPRWLEPEEMNLKHNFEVECLGVSITEWQGEKVEATKYKLTGGGIAAAYYWVSDDGILRQILMDRRKTIQFEFNVPQK